MAASRPRLRRTVGTATLAQITPANAKNLHVAWTFSTGVLRGHEGQPLVVDNTMYLVTPYPNVAYALDLTQPGFPLKWKYRPENAQAAVGVACCDVVNRGASFANGKIVYNLLDGHTVAVDAATGTELWRVKMGDVNRGETITMAPIVVKDKVHRRLERRRDGRARLDRGARSRDRQGALARVQHRPRRRHEGRAALQAVLRAGSRREPRRRRRGRATRGRSAAPSVWGWLSYDPELNLVYHGTSNPGPWNGNQRPGDNKWSAAIIARDRRHRRDDLGVPADAARHLGLRRGQ